MALYLGSAETFEELGRFADADEAWGRAGTQRRRPQAERKGGSGFLEGALAGALISQGPHCRPNPAQRH